jgi:23S rRNA pseudouridine955/2504/2580 synthase
MHRHWKVTVEDLPTNLQKFLQRKLVNWLSLREIKQGLNRNCCLLNNHVERFGTVKLKARDEILWFFQPSDKHIKKDEPFSESRILLEDESLFVYNKPSGISTMDRGLLELLSSRRQLFPVHRLDKDTSGVILFAKTKEIQEKLIMLFSEKKVEKEYLALVQGIPKIPKGKIECYLGIVHQFQGQKVYGKVPKHMGRYSLSNYQVLRQGKKHSLVHLKPETGRTHQLRSHVREIGHPIVGDIQYGWQENLGYWIPHFYLHSWKVHFHHPKIEKKMDIEAPIPHDFSEMELRLLGNKT